MKQKLKEFLSHFTFFYYKLLYLRYKIHKNRIKHITLEEKLEIINKDYKKIFHKEINWKNPKTLSEKINYFKVFNPELEKYASLTDKLKVRNWIKTQIGEEYLIPLLGIYDNFDEIDFASLPNSFVIKCNHDCGSTTIIKNKNTINIKKLKCKYDYFMKRDFSNVSFEEHYSLIKPKILIEKYIVDNDGNLPDYKFWCFDSKVYYCRVDFDRFGNHKRNTYDLEWNLLPWTEGIYEQIKEIKRPQNYSKMIKVAEKLCKDFPEVRVDLYNVNGKIYFGEMTFTSASGLEYIEPDIDLMLGNLWKENSYIKEWGEEVE